MTTPTALRPVPECPTFARVRWISDTGVLDPTEVWGTVRDERPVDDDGMPHTDLRWVEWDDEAGLDLVPVENLTEA